MNNNSNKIEKELKSNKVFVRLNNRMYSKIEELSIKNGITKSELFREAIRRMLKDIVEDENRFGLTV